MAACRRDRRAAPGADRRRPARLWTRTSSSSATPRPASRRCSHAIAQGLATRPRRRRGADPCRRRAARSATSRRCRTSSPRDERAGDRGGDDAHRERGVRAPRQHGSPARATSCCPGRLRPDLGPRRHPLQPLLDLSRSARDIGLHVVIARRVGGSARGAYGRSSGACASSARPASSSAATPARGRSSAGSRRARSRRAAASSSIAAGVRRRPARAHAARPLALPSTHSSRSGA